MVITRDRTAMAHSCPGLGHRAKDATSLQGPSPADSSHEGQSSGGALRPALSPLSWTQEASSSPANSEGPAWESGCHGNSPILLRSLGLLKSPAGLAWLQGLQAAVKRDRNSASSHRRGAGGLDAAGRGAARADREPGTVRAALQRGGPTPGLQAHGPVPEEDEEACGGHRAQRLGAAPAQPRSLPLTQICPCPPPYTGSPHRCDPRSTYYASGTGQCPVHHLTLFSPGSLRSDLIITILFYK